MYYWKDAFGPPVFVDIKGAIGNYDPIKESEMKKCHACGQTLPLKVGDVVEGRYSPVTSSKITGVVIEAIERGGRVQPFNGGPVLYWAREQLTRLHGYYRITEREPLA